MKNILKSQYDHVISSRSVLLQYCWEIPFDKLTLENSSFGRGSIRNLLVHTANCYEFWVGKNALKKDDLFTTYKSQENIVQIENLFLKVDHLMEEFIKKMNEGYNRPIDYEINGIKGVTDYIQIFTHVTMHEFHHKGQILSLSRHLGYIPVDTDVIR